MLKTRIFNLIRPQRKIFITNPALKFELPPEEFMELLKPIYGLADIGDE